MRSVIHRIAWPLPACREMLQPGMRLQSSGLLVYETDLLWLGDCYHQHGIVDMLSSATNQAISYTCNPRLILGI